MAMFGTRKQTFGQIPGMVQPPMQQPPMGQVGAMQPDMGAMTKKPNFFQKNGNTIIGVIGDTLATLGGGQGVYAPAMIAQKQQDAEIRARLQAALEQRKAAREDKQWEWENKPKEERAPYRWESNDGSLMEVGPDGQPRVVYKDPTKRPEYRQGPDGRFYPIDTATGPLPTFTDDDWNKGQPVGGSVGNGTGGFRGQ